MAQTHSEPACNKAAGRGVSARLKALESTLRASEQRYAALFNAGCHGIAYWQVIVDKQGKPTNLRCLRVNPAFEKIVGLKKEQAEGRLLTEIFPGIEKAPQNYIGKYGGIALNGGELVREDYFEFAHTWVSDYVFSPAPGEVAVIFTDITERKKAENALRASEEKFRMVVENLSEGINMLDLKTMRYVYFSPAQVRMTGFTMDEINGITAGEVYDRIHPDDRELSVYQQKQVIAGKDVGLMEYRWKVKSGEYRWFSDSRKLVRDAHGNPVALVGISRDITSRKRGEEELRRSQQIIQNVNSIILTTDRNGNITFINDYGLKYFGYTRDELMGRNVVGTLMPETESTGRDMRVLSADILANPDKYHPSVNENIRKNGERVWISWTNRAMYDAAGHPAGVFTVGNDVTALKRTRDEAGRGKSILDALMTYVPEVLQVIDKDHVVVRDSRFSQQIVGYSAEQIEGISLEQRARLIPLYHPDATLPAGIEELPVARVLASGTSVINEEWKVETAGGDFVDIAINAGPMKDSAGNVTGAVTTWHDITERKRIEKMLKESEEKFRQLSEASPAAVLLYRNDRHLYVNQAAVSIFGYTKEELLAMNFIDLAHPDYREDIRERVRIRMQGGKRQARYELKALTKSGEVKWLDVSTNFVHYEGKPAGIVICLDITERKRAEAQIRYISFHDEVTGLFNRAFFEEEIHRVDTERSLPITIIVGDVNNLKLMNDVFGHEQGDMLLKVIADAFRKACRKNDIIARWGGDEFSVILPKTDTATAEMICRRIKHVAKESNVATVAPSISLGIATKDSEEQNIYQVNRRAEERMYRNKLDESRQNENDAFASFIKYVRLRNNDIDAHLSRSLDLADRFGRELSLSESQMDDLRLLIRLHDIGDVAVPVHILAKPGRLSAAEWEVMKKHVETGFRITRTFADTARISDEVFAHAEHWDGTGYPRGLKGKKIPSLVRIFSVIDAYDIMTHDRPYARAYSRLEALEELRRNAGSQFDPALAEVFIRMQEREAVRV